jgi:hypothetical protein
MLSRSLAWRDASSAQGVAPAIPTFGFQYTAGLMRDRQRRMAPLDGAAFLSHSLVAELTPQHEAQASTNREG